MNIETKPRLIHESLTSIPLGIRFGIAGLFNNAIFLFVYNSAVNRLDHLLTASSIYSIVSILLIPVGHAVASLFVFGWPISYWKNLLSNVPIGLSATVIGTISTALLDRISFNQKIHLLISRGISVEKSSVEDSGEFYSSIIVMIITGAWCFFLSILVNKPSTKKLKTMKEL